MQELPKCGDIQLRHGKAAIVYLEYDNAVILQECRLRRQLFVQLLLCVLKIKFIVYIQTEIFDVL